MVPSLSQKLLFIYWTDACVHMYTHTHNTAPQVVKKKARDSLVSYKYSTYHFDTGLILRDCICLVSITNRLWEEAWGVGGSLGLGSRAVRWAVRSGVEWRRKRVTGAAWQGDCSGLSKWGWCEEKGPAQRWRCWVQRSFGSKWNMNSGLSERLMARQVTRGEDIVFLPLWEKLGKGRMEWKCGDQNEHCGWGWWAWRKGPWGLQVEATLK